MYIGPSRVWWTIHSHVDVHAHTLCICILCKHTKCANRWFPLTRPFCGGAAAGAKHTHTHVHTYTCYTHKHTHTDKYYITCMHAWIHTYIDGFLSHILCMIWMYTHDMNMHASMHKYAHKYIFIYTHTNIYTYQYACIHAHKHAYMNRWFSVAHTFRGAAVAGAALPLPLPHCSSPRSCVSPFVDGRLITCVHIRHGYIHILHT
jgi:hypothetical protein